MSFGYLSANFRFDFRQTQKPKINGIIIAEGSVNKRDGFEDCTYYISFYVIKNSEYNKTEFVEHYLPMLFEWYQNVLKRPVTALSGVENFLVVWDNGRFKIHNYRYL